MNNEVKPWSKWHSKLQSYECLCWSLYNVAYLYGQKIVLPTYMGKKCCLFMWKKIVLPTYMGKNSVVYLCGQR